MNSFNLRIIDQNTLLKIQTAAIYTGITFKFNQCEYVTGEGITKRCQCCIRHRLYYTKYPSDLRYGTVGKY